METLEMHSRFIAVSNSRAVSSHSFGVDNYSFEINVCFSQLSWGWCRWDPELTWFRLVEHGVMGIFLVKHLMACACLVWHNIVSLCLRFGGSNSRRIIDTDRPKKP
jgi:hypothetical protein